MKEMMSFKSLVAKTGVMMVMLLMFMCLYAVYAVANDGTEVPVDQFIAALLVSINGWAGFSTVAKINVVIQTGLLAFNTKYLGAPLAKLSGKYKMTIVLLLTLIGTTLGLVISDGLTWSAALTHGATASAFAVLINQIYKQFFTEKGEE